MSNSHFKKGTYNAICDVCGFKFKADQLRQTWKGHYVCSEDYETRHPSDLYNPPLTETPPPWTRPEAPHIFVEVTYVGGPTPAPTPAPTPVPVPTPTPTPSPTPPPVEETLSLVITSTPHAESYGLGDVVDFSYTVTSLSNVELVGLNVTSLQATINNPTRSSLAPYDSYTVTGSMTITQAMVDADEWAVITSVVGFSPSNTQVGSSYTHTINTVSGTYVWDNVEVTSAKRPVYNNPVIIDTQEQLDSYITTYSELPPGATPSPSSPGGEIHYIYAPALSSLDVILDARAMTITKPVKILQARNVGVIGGVWDAVTPPGGGVGECANLSGGQLIHNANLYPRLVGGNMLQISASHTTFLEGLYMDLKGHNNDAIVVNSNSGVTAASDLANKRVYLINSIIKGFVGHLANHVDGGPGGGPLGDGLHADAIQMQSEYQSWKEFIVENLHIHTGQEGIVFNCVAPEWGERSVVRKFVAEIDQRYIDPNPEHHQYIAPLATNAKSLKLEDCYVYRTQLWGGSAPVQNQNHFLYYSPTSKIMYFTAPNGGWGNAWADEEQNPVANGVELNMETFEPYPWNPSAYTSVVRHDGLQTFGGTIADGDIGSPPANALAFVPEDKVGANYVPAEEYTP